MALVSKVSTWAKTFSIGFVTNFIYCARRFTSANCKKSFVTYLLTLYTILEFGCAQIFVSRCITHFSCFLFFQGLASIWLRHFPYFIELNLWLKLVDRIFFMSKKLWTYLFSCKWNMIQYLCQYYSYSLKQLVMKLI